MVRVLRGDHVESRHQVHLVLVNAEGEVRAACGRVDEIVFLRSAAKPFQAAAVLASGAFDRDGVTDDEIAIMAASHSGESVHVAIVSRLLARIGLDEKALGCGVHPPFDAATAVSPGSPISHNCSGKHAGMLALARHLGAPAESYLDQAGPAQQAILEGIAALCGIPRKRVVIAVDGCGAATFAVPLAAAARAFALLARPAVAPAELREPLARVAGAMVGRPHLIGGTGRFDTVLMSAAGGRLISKAGAEAVQGVADRKSGLGLFLKVVDGSARATAPATLESLHQTGWLPSPTPASLQELWHPAITNHAGRTVGRVDTELRLA